MKKLLSVIMAGALFTMACTGMTESTVTINLPSADGLVVGQPVKLNGIDIGEVSSVAFQEGSDGVAAKLSLSDEGLTRLDPNTIFVVMRNKEEGPPRVVVASNLCAETPRGLSDGAVLEGYSGPMVRVMLQASSDRPECASALVEGLLMDLQNATMQLDQNLTPPQ
jgi:hypothetical protein